MYRMLLLLIVLVCVMVHGTDRVTFQMKALENGLGFAQGIYAIGDIDGDGKNDIVAGGNNPRLWWMKYPDLTTRHSIANPSQVGFEVHVADVDNDGDLDVMTSGGGIKWYENPRPAGNPATSSWREHSFGSEGTGENGGGHDFKVGDINHDGKIDCVERDQGSGFWIVYIQQNPDSWTAFHVNASRDGEGTALGDIDGDGDLDLSDGWAWFECPGNPATGTWTQHNIGNATHTLTRAVIADINEDGRKDVVSSPTEFGGTSLIWWEAPQNPKTGAWTGHTMVNYNDPNFHTLQVGDIDRDGHLDILVGSTHGPCTTPKLMWIFYNVNGNGTSWVEQKWTSADGCWQGVLGDVGSDGDLDILTADYGGGAAQFWENKLNPVTSIAGRPFRNQSPEPRAYVYSGALTVKGIGGISGLLPVIDVSGRTVMRDCFQSIDLMDQLPFSAGFRFIVAHDGKMVFPLLDVNP